MINIKEFAEKSVTAKKLELKLEKKKKREEKKRGEKKSNFFF